MAQKTYSEKLKDPRWQKKRLKILERDDFTCRRCLDSESTLHVHHIYYRSGKEPWEALDQSLITLCETCHSEEPKDYESAMGSLNDVFGSMNLVSHEIVDIACAFHGFNSKHFTSNVWDALGHLLQNPESVRQMIRVYSDHLSESNKNRIKEKETANG